MSFDQAKCWNYLATIKEPVLNQYQLQQIQILFNTIEQYQPTAGPIIGVSDDGHIGFTWMTNRYGFVASVEIHLAHSELYMVISRNKITISEDIVDLSTNGKLEVLISFCQSEMQMLAANAGSSDQ